MKRLLLFGGSFDPLHHGHLIVSRHVAEQLDVDTVVLIPSPSPPHKQTQVLTPARDRLAMCRLAVAGDPQFRVSDWELTQAGPSYTLHTVKHFQNECDGAELCWLIGMDSLLELGTWYRATELVEECRIVTAARPGFAVRDRSVLEPPFSPTQVDRLLADVVEGPHIDISARDVRARRARGASIRYLVPDAILQYIDDRDLYRVR